METVTLKSPILIDPRLKGGELQILLVGGIQEAATF